MIYHDKLTDLKFPSTGQYVRFGILCARAVYSEPSFVAWANGWLDGSDRSAAAAKEARVLKGEGGKPEGRMAREAARDAAWAAEAAAEEKRALVLEAVGAAARSAASKVWKAEIVAIAQEVLR